MTTAQQTMDKYRDLTREELCIRLLDAERKVSSLENDADFFAARVKSLTTELTDTKRDLSGFWYSIAMIGKSLDVEVPDRAGLSVEKQWLEYAKAVEKHLTDNSPTNSTPSIDL